MDPAHNRTRIPPALFLLLTVTPPAGLRAADPAPAVAAAGPARRAPRHHPVDFRRGHVLIPATVAGANSQFILDAGTSLTMLPPGLGDALQLRRPAT